MVCQGFTFTFRTFFAGPAVGAGKIKIRDPRWTHGDPRQLLPRNFYRQLDISLIGEIGFGLDLDFCDVRLGAAFVFHSGPKRIGRKYLLAIFGHPDGSLINEILRASRGLPDAGQRAGVSATAHHLCCSFSPSPAFSKSNTFLKRNEQVFTNWKLTLWVKTNVSKLFITFLVTHAT